MATRIGHQFGNYRLIRLLGRGGFAEVYQGEQVYLNTQAALKILHVKLTEEREHEFLHEARTIAHLEHPHIMQVLDYGVQDGTPFLVIRYAPHGSLRTAHPKGTLLPLETIVTYVKQVAAALQYAHECKLIHRDIKPENMLLGTHHEVVLSDFGLAIMAQSSGHQELQHVVGTISYMAPEQFRGKPCMASDQYALGVVVYEWLCGAPLFVGSYLEVAMQHLTAPVPPLREIIPGLSLAVEQVVLTALNKDPTQRFASITAFATALEKALLPEEVQQAEHSISERHSHSLPLPYLGRQHRGPIVGRMQEWECLRQLLQEIESGTRLLSADDRSAALHWTTTSRPSCMMLLGEAGIGKTRLAEELSREAQRRGWDVVWSRGYAQESSIPYRLWIEFVRTVIQQGLWQPQEGKLLPLLSHSLPALTALMPELADLLPQDVSTSAAAPGQEQLRLWEGILALVTTMSERRPLLIILDDVHWADDSSCELLSYLARRLVGQRILVLGTCRERDLPSSHPLRALLVTLEREQALNMLHISPLTDTEISMLVGDMPTPLSKRIQRYAVGNPFFAEELARVFSTERTTSREAPSSLKQTGALPRTITAILDLRMGSISSACQHLLARAAVLGGSFEYHTIRFMEAGDPDVDEDTILDLLEEALQAGMLTEEGSGTRITYSFWHPLLVNHLYDGLSAGRRASLHRHAAEVLLQIYQGREEEGAATIAYHLVNGGADSPQIAHYAELAGDRAYALSAYPEAVQHYRLAVEHGGTLPAEATLDEHLHLAELLERLGECTRVQGNYPEARRYFEQALEVHTQYRLSASQFDPHYEAQIEALLWCEIGRTWFDIGDYEHAQQYYCRGEQVLREAKVAEGPTWANLHLRQSYVLWQEGSFEEARQTAHHALSIFEHVHRQQNRAATYAFHSTATRRTLEGDPVDLGQTHRLLAAIAATVGQSTMALDHLNTALAIFEQYDRQREIALVCGDIGDVHLRKGEHALVQASLRRSLRIAERIGDASIMSVAFGNLGILAARLGDLPEAEAYFKQAIVLAEQVNDPVYMSLYNAYLTTIMQDQGRVNEAKVSVCQALTIGRAMNFTICIGIALVVLGQLHIAQALVAQANDSGSPLTIKSPAKSSYTYFLRRARISLQRALALEGLEAETRTEGQLALAQVSLLLGEVETAQQQALQTTEESRRYEQTWLLTCAQRLKGDILSAKGLLEQAEQQYQQTLQEFRAYGMRLEYARTMHKYGIALLERSTPEETNYQKGLSNLREARKHFTECQSALDLQAAERILVAYDETSTQKKLPV